MKLKLNGLLRRAALFLTSVAALMFPAFASTDNPLMGDTQGRYIGVVIAVAVVALAVIVIIAVTSSKKKK